MKISINISFVYISQLSPQSSSSSKHFKIFISLYVCVHAACLPACLCAWLWKPEASDFTGTGVTGGCELPEVGPRAQEQYALLTVSHLDSLTSQDGFTLPIIVLDDLEPHILLLHFPNACTSCRLDMKVSCMLGKHSINRADSKPDASVLHSGLKSILS